MQNKKNGKLPSRNFLRTQHPGNLRCSGICQYINLTFVFFRTHLDQMLRFIYILPPFYRKLQLLVN